VPRYLVVANQTLGSAELRQEIRKRFEPDPDSSFYVLVPNTRAEDYHGVPVAGGFVPMPTLITRPDLQPMRKRPRKRSTCWTSS
jgi:hypothetical protein